MSKNLQELQNLFVWPEQKPKIKDTDLLKYDSADGRVYASHPNSEATNIIPNQPMLQHLLDVLKPKLILELGSWMGTNTTKFFLQNTSDTHLICIDHWSDDYHDYVHDSVTTLEVWENTNNIHPWIHLMPYVWDCFLINGWSNRHRLTPIRKNTREGLSLLKPLNLPVDLIYIDANHSYEEAFHDIKTCCEIWPEATVCGDDLYWPDGGVRRAVEECAFLFGKIIHDLNGTWYYSK